MVNYFLPFNIFNVLQLPKYDANSLIFAIHPSLQHNITQKCPLFIKDIAAQINAST